MQLNLATTKLIIQCLNMICCRYLNQYRDFFPRVPGLFDLK